MVLELEFLKRTTKTELIPRFFLYWTLFLLFWKRIEFLFIKILQKTQKNYILWSQWLPQLPNNNLQIQQFEQNKNIRIRKICWTWQFQVRNNLILIILWKNWKLMTNSQNFFHREPLFNKKMWKSFKIWLRIICDLKFLFTHFVFERISNS